MGRVIRNDPAIDLETQTSLCRGWTFEDEDDDEDDYEYPSFRTPAGLKIRGYPI